jgi:predicted metal-binding membrane protein
MNDAALEAVLRRDRAIVLVALLLLGALAWNYLFGFSVHMNRSPTT